MLASYLQSCVSFSAVFPKDLTCPFWIPSPVFLSLASPFLYTYCPLLLLIPTFKFSSLFRLCGHSISLSLHLLPPSLLQCSVLDRVFPAAADTHSPSVVLGQSNSFPCCKAISSFPVLVLGLWQLQQVNSNTRVMAVSSLPGVYIPFFLSFSFILCYILAGIGDTSMCAHFIFAAAGLVPQTL